MKTIKSSPAGRSVAFSMRSVTKYLFTLIFALTIAGATQLSGAGIVAPPPQQSEQGEITKDSPFINTEVMPQFRGGDLKSFRGWVLENFKYPKKALKKRIEGRVVVRFVVEKDGTISGVEVVSSPHKLLSDEAVRVISSSPRWTPGSENGEPVRLVFTLPLEFRLSK